MHNSKANLVLNSLLLMLLTLGLSACVNPGGKGEVDEEKAMDSYIKLAMAYIENGNRESARHHLSRAFELDSDSVRATAAQAMLYQLEGEPELAEENFRKVLRREPDFSRARNNYAAFLFQHERYQEAFEQFEKVADDLAYTNRDLALLNLGRAALKVGKEERAKAAFEHAHQLNRRMPAALIELAEMSFNDGNYAQTKQYLDHYTTLTQPAARSLLLGIKIERIFGNKNKEASLALALKNLFPYSQEYLEYKRTMND